MIELENEDYESLVAEKKRCEALVREFEKVEDKEPDRIYYSGKISGIREALRRLTIYNGR